MVTERPAAVTKMLMEVFPRAASAAALRRLGGAKIIRWHGTRELHEQNQNNAPTNRSIGSRCT